MRKKGYRKRYLDRYWSGTVALDILFVSVADRDPVGSVYFWLSWIRILIRILHRYRNGSRSGSSNLKVDHKLKSLEYFMNFFQICLKFFISFSFLSKEILHELKKYELNGNFLEKM